MALGREEDAKRGTTMGNNLNGKLAQEEKGRRGRGRGGREKNKNVKRAPRSFLCRGRDDFEIPKASQTPAIHSQRAQGVLDCWG